MSAPINRSLATVKTELEFLVDSNVITKNLYDHLLSVLPDRYTTGAPAKDYTPAMTHTTSNTSNASSHQEEYAQALYDYKPVQNEDLELRVGDKIVILEKTSKDWWKGRIGSSIGMFPSNYVKIIGSDEKHVTAQQYNPYQQQAQQPMYQQPIQYHQSSTPIPFPPQEFQQQQQQPIQQQQVVQQEQQQQHHHHGEHFKKFGKKLGNAAIFGAGATIGSDIVNSIF